MTNMAFEMVDRVFLVAFGPEDPTDQEWSAYLRAVEAQGIEHTMQLVVSAGGVPTAAQRRLLTEKLAGRTVPVAVLSASLWVRGVARVMRFWNRSIQAFSPYELPDALAHLDILQSRMGLIRATFERLQEELGQP
jgi:hypothetical protein